jgi:nucleotide-binding universal stress UspA family protein
MKRQAEADFVKIFEKIQESTTNSTKKGTLKIKIDLIVSFRTAHTIVSYTKDKQVGLIVSGTRGRRKLKSTLLSSVASHVNTCSLLSTNSKAAGRTK